MGVRLRCPRGHNLARFTLIECPQHGDHQRYVCPMRLGNRRCGQEVVVPPIERNCALDEHDPGGH